MTNLASTRLFTSLLIMLGMASLAGCARLPIQGTRAADLIATSVAKAAPGLPWAINPADGSIALARDGLHLVTSGNESWTVLPGRPPTALGWSSDGSRLGAAFPREGGTNLSILTRKGNVLAEAFIPGRVTSMGWVSPTELVALGVQIREFSFGGDVIATLYRWDGTAPPQGTVLHDMTVKPLTIRQWGERIITSITMNLSPDGDEIVYTRLHDPPAFTPYLRIVLRHLESGAEQELASVDLTSAGARYVGTGDRIVYGDGFAITRVLDSRQEGVFRTFPVPGKELAASPAGTFLLLDGHLYQGGEEIATFPPTARGCFASGGALYVSHDERLYLVMGLTELVPPPLPPADAERLRILRKWRSDGLISDREYRDSIERTTPP
jgi:hypothetical protein